MGACSGGDKLPAEEITVDAATLGLTSADESQLSEHFVIKTRSGTEAATLSLLTASGFDGATYGARTIDGANVVYTDWTASNDDASMRAERVEMIGLNETDGGPTLDKLVVSGMQVDGFEGEAENRVKVMDATVGSLVVVKPSAAMFANLADIMMAEDASSNAATDTLEELSAQMDFRAFQVEDMAANVMEDGNTGTLSLKQIIVGNDKDEGMMDIVLETLDFVWVGANGNDAENFAINMDGLTVMGLDTEQLNNAPNPSGGIASSLMAGLSPASSPPYRQIDFGKFNLTSAIVDVTSEGFEADSTSKGSTVELRSVFAPTLITLKDMSATRAAPFMEALRDNGLAEISLKGSSLTSFDLKADRVSVTDSRFEIDEGLRTRCDYSLMGLKAAEDALEASGLSQPVLDMADVDDREGAFEKYLADMQAYSEAQTEANKAITLEAMNCDIQDVADNSLVERGYQVASAITGRSVPVLKGGAKTMIALGSLTAQSEFQRDLMDTVGSGLIDFIDTPGQTMTVTMAPSTPVSITSLIGTDGAEPSIKPLNLSVEVR
jgi:hypothetical protein